MANLVDTGVNGDLRVTGNIYGNVSGNATTATTWATGRTFKIQDHDATNTGASVAGVNGSADVTLKLPSTIKATLTGTASRATAVNYEASNEINFANGTPTGVWFNYKCADTGAATPDNLITEYIFGNRNKSSSGVTLRADKFSGNAATSSRPLGFDSRNADQPAWGVLQDSTKYAPITAWLAGTTAAIAFGRDKNTPAGHADQTLTVQVDGCFYQNEGRYRVLDTSDVTSSYSASGTAPVNGTAVKEAIDTCSPTSHTHSVVINEVTKTIAASGGTAVNLGTFARACSLGESDSAAYYSMFTRMGITNSVGNGEAQIIIASAGNFGQTNMGTWLITMSNRGSSAATPTATMTVRCLNRPTKVYPAFGYYYDTENSYIYFGVHSPGFRGNSAITVLSSAGALIMNFGDTTTKPTGFTEVPATYYDNVQPDWNATSGDAFIQNKPYYRYDYKSSDKIIKVCTIKYASNDSIPNGFTFLTRYGVGGLHGIVMMKGGTTCKMYQCGTNSVSAGEKVTFSYVASGSGLSAVIDIYATVMAYVSLSVAPLDNLPKDKVDFSSFGTVVDTLPDGKVNITPVWMTSSSASSGNAPVKVDAYGTLSAVPMDSTPTTNSPNLMTSGSIKTALDKKVNLKTAHAYRGTSGSTVFKLAEMTFLKSQTRSFQLVFDVSYGTHPKAIAASRLTASFRTTADTSAEIGFLMNSMVKNNGFANDAIPWELYAYADYETGKYTLYAKYISGSYVTVEATCIQAHSEANNYIDTVTVFTTTAAELPANATPETRLWPVTTSNASTVGSNLQPVFLDSYGVPSTIAYKTWINNRADSLTAMSPMWYATSGSMNTPADGNNLRYVELALPIGAASFDLDVYAFVQSNPFVLRIQLSNFTYGSPGIIIKNRVGYAGNRIYRIITRWASSVFKVYFELDKTVTSFSWRSNHTLLTNDMFSLLTKAQYDALTSTVQAYVSLVTAGAISTSGRNKQRGEYGVLDTGDVASTYAADGTAPVNGKAVKSAIDTRSPTSHTHSVKINGAEKTIAATGGNAVDLGNYPDYVYFGNSSPIGSGSPADQCKTYFTSTVPVGKIRTGYNYNGDEYTLIFSKQAGGNYGNIIKYGYASKYIYMLRHKNSQWLSDDWEKISAGYADSAGSATSADKLTTPRTTYVTLGTASTTTTRDWSDTTTIPVNGTLQIGNGGTGQTTALNIVNETIQAGLGTGDGDVSDSTDMVTSHIDGYSSTNKGLYRRKATKLWSYIKGKLTSDTGVNISGNAATANSAAKVSTTEDTSNYLYILGVDSTDSNFNVIKRDTRLAAYGGKLMFTENSKGNYLGISGGQDASSVYSYLPPSGGTMISVNNQTEINMAITDNYNKVEFNMRKYAGVVAARETPIDDYYFYRGLATSYNPADNIESNIHAGKYTLSEKCTLQFNTTTNALDFVFA